MKTKLLGRTGISVSELCFGTMSFGGDADEATSAAMYKAVRDAGINFFDCANEYNKGKSEEILGRLAKGERDDLVLTTKCFNPTGPDVNARGASRRHVVRAVEASLKRLQTDRIDVLFLHRFDPVTPIDEMMRALEDMVRAGKVIYPAVSNWAAWQTQRAVDLQERHNWARLQVVQPMYSLVKRQAEVEILPMAEANGIGSFPTVRRRRACSRASTSARHRDGSRPTRCTRHATATNGCSRSRRNTWRSASRRTCIQSGRRLPGWPRIPPSRRPSSGHAMSTS